MADDVVADLKRLQRIEPNEMVCAVYARAIAEVEHLRSLAGAITPGPSASDIKRQCGAVDAPA